MADLESAWGRVQLDNSRSGLRTAPGRCHGLYRWGQGPEVVVEFLSPGTEREDLG